MTFKITPFSTAKSHISVTYSLVTTPCMTALTQFGCNRSIDPYHSHKVDEVGLSELIRIADTMGLTSRATLLLICSGTLASLARAAVCPHEDGSFDNWSSPATWDDGKVNGNLQLGSLNNLAFIHLSF